MPVTAAAGRAAAPLFAHELPRYRSGEQLLADCRSAEPAERGRCAGYVMAVADMLGGASARIDGLTACLIGNETLDERSEEHTSELQSLMRISYAVFCLKKTTT